MRLLATGNSSHCTFDVLYGDVSLKRSQNYRVTHLTKSSDMLNKNTLGVKKGEANQKQQLSDYSCD